MHGFQQKRHSNVCIGDFKIKHVQEENYLGSLATDD